MSFIRVTEELSCDICGRKQRCAQYKTETHYYYLHICQLCAQIIVDMLKVELDQKDE